jgi:hypothetical protein
MQLEADIGNRDPVVAAQVKADIAAYLRSVGAPE